MRAPDIRLRLLLTPSSPLPPLDISCHYTLGIASFDGSRPAVRSSSLLVLVACGPLLHAPLPLWSHVPFRRLTFLRMFT